MPMPAHVREAAERLIQDLQDDEARAMLIAFENTRPTTSYRELLMVFFHQLGHANPAAAAAAAIEAGALDPRDKLN